MSEIECKTRNGRRSSDSRPIHNRRTHQRTHSSPLHPLHEARRRSGGLRRTGGRRGGIQNSVNLEYDGLGDPNDALGTGRYAGETLPPITFSKRDIPSTDLGELHMVLSFHINGNMDVSAASIALTYDFDAGLLELSLSKTSPSNRQLGLNKLLSLVVVLISHASKRPVCLKAASRYTVLAAVDTGFTFDTECQFPIYKEYSNNTWRLVTLYF